MGINYRKKYICECCGKEYINLVSVKRCCNFVDEKKKKNSDRSFRFRIVGDKKPESKKEAFRLLGTVRENIVGYYKHRIDENNNKKMIEIINLSHPYISKTKKPKELYEYSFYLVMFSEKKD